MGRAHAPYHLDQRSYESATTSRRRGGGPIHVWQVEADGTLESKIAAIVAGLVVAGEAMFPERLRLEEEKVARDRIEREARVERKRIEREQRRIARLKDMNRQRVANLQKSGKLLRLSSDIRILIELVGGSLAGRIDVNAATIEAWKHWGRAKADRLDPIFFGQVLFHLRPPSLEGSGGVASARPAMLATCSAPSG